MIKEDKLKNGFMKLKKQIHALVSAINENKINNLKNNNIGFDKINFINNSIPSVIHVDNSARIQTVTKSSNDKLYNILDEFEKITNCPILINTSFNKRRTNSRYL